MVSRSLVSLHFVVVDAPLKELIAKGANVNAARPSDGATALILAAQWGELRVVEVG